MEALEIRNRFVAGAWRPFPVADQVALREQANIATSCGQMTLAKVAESPIQSGHRSRSQCRFALWTG